MARLDGYQRKLFVFLSVATFFEGYDFIALSQILPNLRADFALSKQHAGWMLGIVNAGTVIAYLLVRKADAWGRRRVLTVTILGYTVCTFMSGLAYGPYDFTAWQLVARVFLIAEWATSMVIAAEEFPSERRGMVIGVLQAFSSLGGIVCAGVVPYLLELPYAWRSVYFVAILPLIALAYMRRNLRETKRFAELSDDKKTRPLFAVWSTPYKKRILQLGVIWMATYACSNTAITFWKDFVLSERGFTDKQAGLSITIAAVASMPLVFLSGKLLDWVGRKPGATIIFILTSVGVAGSYTLRGHLPLTAALVLGIFGVSAVLPVLNAFTSELFPTELRGDAFAWANNLIGRLAYVASPVAVGHVAAALGWGPAVAATAVFPILALALIWWWIPETNAMELEETAAL